MPAKIHPVALLNASFSASPAADAKLLPSLLRNPFSCYWPFTKSLLFGWNLNFSSNVFNGSIDLMYSPPLALNLDKKSFKPVFEDPDAWLTADDTKDPMLIQVTPILNSLHQ